MSDLQIAAAKDNNKQVRQKKEEAGGKRSKPMQVTRYCSKVKTTV